MVSESPVIPGIRSPAQTLLLPVPHLPICCLLTQHQVPVVSSCEYSNDFISKERSSGEAGVTARPLVYLLARRSMQPLVLQPPSLTTSQFGQSRFNSGPERLSLNRPWSTNARGCSPRASLCRQPMSGSLPVEEPSVTSGETTRPLACYPPAASSAAATAGGPVPVSYSTSITGPALSLPVVTDALPALAPPRFGEPHRPVFPGSPHLPSHPPPFPLAGPESTVQSTAARSLTQKSTRRAKAHVASACVNCKKKHLGCDPARPCRRCVLAGKAVSSSLPSEFNVS